MSLIKIEIAIPEDNSGSEPSINIETGELYLFGNDLARAIRDRLIEEGLSSNGHISQTYNTAYEWEGKRYEREERTLTVKAKTEDAEKIAEVVNDMHPYVTPSITFTKIHAVSEDYYSWVKQERGRASRPDMPMP